jgi:hypothetical protein
MPEWEPVTGRVQHDVYHVYTVDQHSLYAVAMMKALARGEHVDQHPDLSQEITAWSGRCRCTWPRCCTTWASRWAQPQRHGARGGAGHRRAPGLVRPTCSGSSSWCAST